MESSPPSSSDAAPPDHQLAPGGHALGRLQQHAQGLSKDVRAWVELRIKLAKIEFWERVDRQANQIALGLIIGVLGALAGFFLLVTIALGLGWLLGHPFWGFLIVAAVLGGLAGLIYSAQPDLGLVSEDRKRATLREDQLTSE